MSKTITLLGSYGTVGLAGAAQTDIIGIGNRGAHRIGQKGQRRVTVTD